MFSAGKGNSTHTWARSKRIEKTDPCMLNVCAAAAILARGLDRVRGGEEGPLLSVSRRGEPGKCPVIHPDMEEEKKFIDFYRLKHPIVQM